MQIATLKYETVSPNCGINSPIYRIAPHIYKVASPTYKTETRIYETSSPICRIDTPIYGIATPIYGITSPKYEITTLIYKVSSQNFKTATLTEKTTEYKTKSKHTNYQQDNILTETDCTQHTPMHTCWLTCISEVLRPHSPCRSATVNTPANRRMRIASVVRCNPKKRKKTTQKSIYFLDYPTF